MAACTGRQPSLRLILRGTGPKRCKEILEQAVLPNNSDELTAQAVCREPVSSPMLPAIASNKGPAPSVDLHARGGDIACRCSSQATKKTMRPAGP
jgi:hypothetical protein